VRSLNELAFFGSSIVVYHPQLLTFLSFSDRLERRYASTPSQKFEDISAEIDLPPLESKLRRMRKGVMVVVPTFPHARQSSKPIVAAFIFVAKWP